MTAKAIGNLTTEDLLRSLRSNTCPSCSMSKGRMKTLCAACYHELSPAVQRMLYKRIGEGYDKAFAEAMRVLGATRPTLPPEKQAG